MRRFIVTGLIGLILVIALAQHDFFVRATTTSLGLPETFAIELGPSLGRKAFHTSNAGDTWKPYESNAHLTCGETCAFPMYDRCSFWNDRIGIGGLSNGTGTKYEVGLSSLPYKLQFIMRTLDWHRFHYCKRIQINGRSYLFAYLTTEKINTSAQQNAAMLQTVGQSAILIATDEVNVPENYYPSFDFRTWTLRLIEGQPFFSNERIAYLNQIIVVLLFAVLVPLMMLLHTVQLNQVIAGIFQPGERALSYRFAFSLSAQTILACLPLLILYVVNPEINQPLVLLCATMITSVLSAWEIFHLCRERRFLLAFRLNRALGGAFVACIVPLSLIAGTWSLIFVGAGLFSYVFYRRVLRTYIERSGFIVVTEESFAPHLRKWFGTVTLIFIVGLYMWNKVQFDVNHFSVTTLIYIGVMAAFVLVGVIPASTLAGKHKKKFKGDDVIEHAEHDPDNRRWVRSQWVVWFSGVAAIMVVGILLHEFWLNVFYEVVARSL